MRTKSDQRSPSARKSPTTCRLTEPGVGVTWCCPKSTMTPRRLCLTDVHVALSFRGHQFITRRHTLVNNNVHIKDSGLRWADMQANGYPFHHEALSGTGDLSLLAHPCSVSDQSRSCTHGRMREGWRIPSGRRLPEDHTRRSGHSSAPALYAPPR